MMWIETTAMSQLPVIDQIKAYIIPNRPLKQIETDKNEKAIL